MPVDFKKTEKELYQPATTPSIIDVPTMKFFAVDGEGDPNTSPDYAAAIELLYGLSYTIKMGHKAELEYVVPPLEGFWDFDSDDFRGGGAAIPDKSEFRWTMIIRQPDFVSEEIVEAAKTTFTKKKPDLDVSKVRLQTITEGLCVQVMHIGPYDAEPSTVAIMDEFAKTNGYVLDIDNSGVRRHHEIYLSDPRKVAPAKMKTVLRHPIRKA